MSKFIDKLKHLSQGTAEPMGFHPRVAASPKPKMQLAAVVSGENLDSLAEFAAVANALLVSVLSRTALEKAAKGAAELPWGVWLKESAGLKEVVPAGCDFIVFPAQSPVEPGGNGKQAGRILAVDVSLADGMLRALNDVPVDAVLLVIDMADGNTLTWERLLVIQRCANLLTKPLLTAVGANVTAGELQAFWTAGIDCVLIEGATPEQLKGVRKTIDSATFILPRRREKPGALIPRISHEPHHVTEEEEEE